VTRATNNVSIKGETRKKETKIPRTSNPKLSIPSREQTGKGEEVSTSCASGVGGRDEAGGTEGGERGE